MKKIKKKGGEKTFKSLWASVEPHTTIVGGQTGRKKGGETQGGGKKSKGMRDLRGLTEVKRINRERTLKPETTEKREERETAEKKGQGKDYAPGEKSITRLGGKQGKQATAVIGHRDISRG